MILGVCSPGHVALAVADAARALGDTLKSVDAVDDDLFTRALGSRAIVYAPEARLLDAEPAHQSAERMRAVVRGAHAPGVQHVVVVLPAGARFDEEELVLKKDGVGYTILRCGPLLDELADATNLHTARSVWLPRGHVVELSSRAVLAQAIRDAIAEDNLCGATVDVPAERVEIAEAMRRAAEIAGAGVRVHITSPSLSFAMRKLYSWMGLAPPDVEALCDRLGGRPSTSRPAPTRAAANA